MDDKKVQESAQPEIAQPQVITQYPFYNAQYTNPIIVTILIIVLGLFALGLIAFMVQLWPAETPTIQTSVQAEKDAIVQQGTETPGQTESENTIQKAAELPPNGSLSRFRGMMNTPQLAAPFLGVAIFDTARLAARSFIRMEILYGQRSPAFHACLACRRIRGNSDDRSGPCI
jgi:hypothetical protein